MAKKKVVDASSAPEEVAASIDAVVDAPAAEVKPAKVSKTEVTVKFRDHKGEPTERTFSKEVHGEDFAKLADEFTETNKSRIIA